MTYRVKINDCLEQFYRAHNALVDSLGGSHHIARTALSGRTRGRTTWDVLSHNWKLKYRATPIGENSRWKYLDFENEQQYILFILRWS